MSGTLEKQKSESAQSANRHGGTRKRTITQKELKKLLSYSPDTGNFKWRKSKKGIKRDFSTGCPNKFGHLRIVINQTHYLAHRLAWLYVYGYMPENNIDHINRDPADNRINNLREVTQQCNLRNARLKSNNKSGVAGVRRNTPHSKWTAEITINYKTRQLCRSDCFLEAVLHRLAAEQCLGWKGCNTTSTAYLYAIKHLKQEKNYEAQQLNSDRQNE